MMRASALLLPVTPRALVQALRALHDGGLLSQLPAADLDLMAQVPAHPVVDALRKNPTPSLDQLMALLELDGPAVDATVFLYGRLTAPADLTEPHRSAALAVLGALPRTADARAPYDPFELTVPIALADRKGTRRAQSVRGFSTLEVEGFPPQVQLLKPTRSPGTLQLQSVMELRVFEETARWLAWAMDRVGALPTQAWLLSLDDD